VYGRGGRAAGDAGSGQHGKGPRVGPAGGRSAAGGNPGDRQSPPARADPPVSGTGAATAAPPTIRRVVAAEWRALRALRLRALRTDPLAFGSFLAREEAFPESQWRERATRDADSADSAQWVADASSSGLVGTATAARADDRWYIFGMWVEPAYRGERLGGRLLDACLGWVLSVHGARPIYLDVNPRQEAARRLYESRGFRATGVSRPLDHAPAETAAQMLRPPGGADDR